VGREVKMVEHEKRIAQLEAALTNAGLQIPPQRETQ
jgi:hypothetical protein